MVESQHHHTSITFKDIPKLREPRQTYLDLLLFDEKEVREKIEDSQPIARVYFTRLEPRQKFYADQKMDDTIFASLDCAELTVEEKYLYDLGDLKRAMCLAVGRYAHNHFRPFLADDCMDMDPFVSREHGLIFINEQKQVCFHDIGTFKKGSTNGTKINDISIVKNEIIVWQTKDYFGLGECVNVVKNADRQIESKFKLRFEMLV